MVFRIERDKIAERLLNDGNVQATVSIVLDRLDDESYSLMPVKFLCVRCSAKTWSEAVVLCVAKMRALRKSDMKYRNRPLSRVKARIFG